MWFSEKAAPTRSAWQLLPRVALATLACLLAVTGCGPTAHTYSASSLPPELQAPKAENAQTLDLSKLATSTMNSELIDRGDVLNVAVAAGYGNERVDTMPVRVGDDGVANIPIIGRVALAGLELQGAEQAIASAAIERGLYRNPAVTVTMNRRRMNRITVLGAVKEPSTYELPRGDSTLLAAIVAAGNLTEDAGTTVEIRRPAKTIVPGAGGDADRVVQSASYSPPGGPPGTFQASGQPMSFKIDLVSAATQGYGGAPLEDGDVVMVERRDPQPIHVIGLVLKPGQFEMPPNQDLHLLDVIAMAGGTTLNVADKIHILRRVPGREQPAVIEVSLKEAKAGHKDNLRIAPGDVISVEETPVTVVMDTIRTFFRVGFTSALPGL